MEWPKWKLGTKHGGSKLKKYNANRECGVGSRSEELGIRNKGKHPSSFLLPPSSFLLPNFPLSIPSVPLCLCERFFSVVLLFLLISCATSPKAGAMLEDGTPDFSFLPAGAKVFLWADVEQAKPLLEALPFAASAGRDASRIMDLTDTALAGLYPKEGSRSFFIAGWGNYPSLRAGASMGLSRNWKKIKSETGNRYWYSCSNKLGVAMGSSLAFASDGDPFSPGLGRDPAPQGFNEFRRGCVLSGWLDDPAVPLGRFMDNMGIPIQIPAEDFLFGAVSAPEDSWEFIFRIRTQSASQARSLLTLMGMARLFLQQAPEGSADGASSGSLLDFAALLFANPAVQEGEYLTIRTGRLSQDRMALLLGSFPVYSD